MDLRKIDELIAEHIMADTIIENDFGPIRTMPFRHYSTDISDAWAVVEKVESHMFTLTAEEDKLPMWGAAFGFWNTEKQDFDLIESLADTAPLAICLAALKVKGIEV